MEEIREYDLHSDPRLESLISLVTREVPDVQSPKLSAIGLIMTVLRWTAYNAPTGELGRFAPEVICNAIEWEHNPALLFKLLLESGFVDSKHRFLRLEEMFESRKGFLKWAFED